MSLQWWWIRLWHRDVVHRVDACHIARQTADDEQQTNVDYDHDGERNEIDDGQVCDFTIGTNSNSARLCTTVIPVTSPFNHAVDYVDDGDEAPRGDDHSNADRLCRVSKMSEWHSDREVAIDNDEDQGDYGQLRANDGPDNNHSAEINHPSIEDGA